VDARASAALRAYRDWLALGNERLEDGGATFIVGRDWPRVYDANHVTDIPTDADPARLLRAAARAFGHAPHLRFDTDKRTSRAFTEALASAGFRASRATLMLAERPPEQVGARPRMRRVASPADWAAMRPFVEADVAADDGLAPEPRDAELGGQFWRYLRAKCPPGGAWLAHAGDTPIGYCNAWVAANGVGVIEWLCTAPAHRNRGVASALLAHCARECRAAGAHAIALTVAEDGPLEFYRKRGFETVAEFSEWWRQEERQAGR